MTLDDVTEDATLASEDVSACCTAAGTLMLEGRARPSADVTRIVSRPVRDSGEPFGFPGVGVVERGEGSSGAKAAAEVAFDFLLMSFQDMVANYWALFFLLCSPAG